MPVTLGGDHSVHIPWITAFDDQELVHIIHIDAPGIGQKIVKWFGTLRPFDPTGF